MVVEEGAGTVTLHRSGAAGFVLVISDDAGSSATVLAEDDAAGTALGPSSWAIGGIVSASGPVMLRARGGRILGHGVVDGAWVAVVEPGPAGSELAVHVGDRLLDTRVVPPRRR
jgi:hypothetical protein